MYRYDDFLKRLIDIISSILLLFIFSPIMVITAIAIKVTSKGPVMAEVPKRLGKSGKPFQIYKFRSMIANAHQLLRTAPKFKKLYEEFKGPKYKLMDDPRVTTVGRFIRKHSLDEIPQLFNVLLGDMSIVGPRPYYLDELEEQQKRYPGAEKLVKEVLKVKPGITGFWQVSGRSEVDFDKRIEMDAYYARKRSLILDFLILLKTPWVMISGKGAA
ncbi:sugar transferase [Candidatus Woesebacteria bacterium]|nr:sugar transferase [Candidatus Woesebacteria bacterium]